MEALMAELILFGISILLLVGVVADLLALTAQTLFDRGDL
jgi:hypothetical protein